MAEEWGPWIEHDGSGCPLPPEVWVRIEGVFPSGTLVEDEDHAGEYSHSWDARMFGVIDSDGAAWGKIIRYRARRPPALLHLLGLVENLAVREREDA